MMHTGKALMGLCLMVISAGVIITALKWPFKTALFPVVIGIPVFFMAMAEFFLGLFGKGESGEKTSTIDFQLSESVDEALAVRRTISIFLWIFGFFFLILFVGFPIAVPIFFVLFLKLKGREGWKISIGLAAVAWICFYGLFIWLLHIPFLEGWIIMWIRMLGIG